LETKICSKSDQDRKSDEYRQQACTAKKWDEEESKKQHASIKKQSNKEIFLSFGFPSVSSMTARFFPGNLRHISRSAKLRRRALALVA